jgi:hypothetical protein
MSGEVHAAKLFAGKKKFMYPLSRWLNGPQSLSVVLEKGKKFTLARK